MNTEDFVTYEQSITLKKLGFNEKCLFYYGPDKVLYPNYTFSTDILRTTDLYRSCNDSTDDNYPIDAPTLSQTQKWLRREKRLSVEPWSCTTGEWYCTIKELPGKLSYTHKQETNKWIDLDNFYNSYEEVLSAGITECIKLL